MIFKATVIKATCISALFFSLSAAADVVVSCRDQKVNNGPIVYSYTFKSTPSRRLVSDITYVSRTTGAIIISSLQVAQYVSAINSLYMVIDDPAETPYLIFSADPRPAYSFSATLKELINGKFYSRALKCALKQI